MGKVIREFGRGFAGAVSRSVDDIVASYPNKETETEIAFGAPVVLSGGGVKNWQSDSAAADFIGFAVRVLKTPETYGGSVASYAPGDTVDVLKRGAMTVNVAGGTPAAGGSVYVVKATGKVTALADGNNTVQLPSCRFTTAKDADGCAELVVTERSL